MRDYYSIKINFTGGIISPGNLLNILKAAHTAKVKSVRFGLRQQLIMEVFREEFNSFKSSLIELNADYEVNNDVFPNIVSSYPISESFSTGNWLTEGIYKDIFDLFDFKPKLKINIVDLNQSFTPFFTGNLNFIASEDTNFWFLFIRFPKTNNIYKWENLIFTNEISRLSKTIEEVIFNQSDLFYENPLADGKSLFKQIENNFYFINKPMESELELPPFMLPYYEGFNKDNNKLWLGIYMRKELYSIPFLNDLCNVCLQTKIGQILVTNWKSIIIKDINVEERHLWSRILDHHQMNIRHGANELNWQLEDNNDEAIQLKHQLVKYLDKYDARTYGLSFAIQTKPKSELFGSIIIRKKPLISISGTGFFNVFDILYTEDFNPNSRKLKVFQKNLLKLHLGEQLRRLCRVYYHSFANPAKIVETKNEDVDFENISIYHSCKHCFTIYDQYFGDSINEINPGIPFSELPETFICSVCEAPKSDFVEVNSYIEF